jgi:protein SCO1/2
MLDVIKKYRIFIGTFVIFSIITISLFYNVLKPSKTLPIYNPADVNPELVDSTVQYIAREHKIADFSFIKTEK